MQTYLLHSFLKIANTYYKDQSPVLNFILQLMLLDMFSYLVVCLVWSRWDSNPWPLECKSSALVKLSYDPIWQILLLLSSPTPTIRKLVWITSGTEYVTLRRDLLQYQKWTRVKITYCFYSMQTYHQSRHFSIRL